MSPPEFTVAGVRIHAIRVPDAVSTIDEWITERSQRLHRSDRSARRRRDAVRPRAAGNQQPSGPDDAGRDVGRVARPAAGAPQCREGLRPGHHGCGVSLRGHAWMATFLLWRSRRRCRRAGAEDARTLPWYPGRRDVLPSVPASGGTGDRRDRAPDRQGGSARRVGWDRLSETGALDAPISTVAEGSCAHRCRSGLRLFGRTQAAGAPLDPAVRIRVALQNAQRAEKAVAAVFPCGAPLPFLCSS